MGYAANYSDLKLSRIADKNRPQHHQQFSTRKAVPHFEPARRHRCDMCREIFECHLCSIHREHLLHIPTRDQQWGPVYVCEGCIDEHDLTIVVCGFKGALLGHAHYHEADAVYYDHHTGEPLPANRSHYPIAVLEFGGEKLRISDWARKLGIHRVTLTRRLDHSTAEEALSAKRHQHRKKAV